MSAIRFVCLEQEEERTLLQKQLEVELAECSEVEATYRNKVKRFMMENGIWHISELDYSWRQKFRQFIAGQLQPSSYSTYEKGFDRIKQHSIQKQMQAVSRKETQITYENQIWFLPYHPDQKLVRRLDKAQRKEELAWDFRRQAPETMKRQIFHIWNFRFIKDSKKHWEQEEKEPLAL